MDNSSSTLQFKALGYTSSPAEYKLYQAALEWDLIDPIVIENRNDLKSEHRWQDKVEPYDHQVKNLITFCRRLPVTLLADDVGLGKTISAGLVASELISRSRISKILVVCPKILGEQWKEELETKFGISAVIASGRELITAQPPDEIGAVITTYHSAREYLDKIAQAGYDMLVLDEAHKLRNLYGVENPPKVAQRFRDALANRLFKYVLMLTATPIQNRLWDIYSLVDLLTVARGHENPFGNEGMFARKFIDDNRTQARKLKPKMRDEFHSIVYGYMSRIRRGDANLHFPERIVQLHTVIPIPEEIELINTISESIEKLNRLAQISILQALLSSPHALATQLNGMAKNGTIPSTLAADVQAIVEHIPITAKLRGIAALIDKLKKEQPEQWRLVIFTLRRETQTTIQAFLEEHGISCGLINGDSGTRNQETIQRFKANPPEIHAIISTEAGSEGVNLQAANVLINYDLPWNPMIVEQRIGRIQRLASEHASVCIFNIVLKDTFEEYIVGRLIEKLQLASNAIGDVEALLEASGIDDEENDSSNGFEEKIRQLVIASLAGKNVEEATRKAEKSIANAKIQLENEQKNINAMLDGMGNAIDIEPRSPKLPNLAKSMDIRSFVLAALENEGTHLFKQSPDIYISELNGKRELIHFNNERINTELISTLYQPGASAFERLVTKIASKNLHRIEDSDQDILIRIENISKNWVNSFNSNFIALQIKEVWRCFSDSALIRARVTVAHDSYERLIEVMCTPNEHCINLGQRWIEPINDIIEDVSSIGLIANNLIEKTKLDPGITEFCRFYTERLVQELKAAGDNLRKKKKLEEDFTPRLEFTLVGLDGIVYRQLKVSVSYELETDNQYTSILTIIPSTNEIINAPNMAKCARTNKSVPEECLGKCEISGLQMLRHLLVQSEFSGRTSLPEYIVKCSLSGKHVLKDEVEESAVTGRLVTCTLLKTSVLSGKRAEPEFFAVCEFSSTEVLKNELAISQISGKRYRIDEQLQSVVSNKTGQRQEFIFCSVTNKPLLPSEAETCEITDKIVVPGILEKCEVTGKKVLPTELEKSTVSRKKALHKFFVSSSLSGARLLEEEAIQSVTGKFCVPLEAKQCLWNGQKCHPADLRICQLTGVLIHFKYITTNGQVSLEPLANLLNGIRRKSDNIELWPSIVASATKILNNKRCKVETAELSPDGQHLAVCLEIRTLLGFRVHHAGLLYSIQDNVIVGRISQGKRTTKGWIIS
jgi:superfamily II DNA or RNA helicase